MMNQIKNISGQAVYVAGNDIDTDRIIPARFMKCITFDGLGEYAFYDVRFNEDGSQKKHPLNQSEYQKASLLISDDNFGCGSSREHAPQALAKFGFQAVIAGSFAEIFYGNCATLGIPCLTLETKQRQELVQLVGQNPDMKITIDLESKKLEAKLETGPKVEQKQFSFEIKDSSRDAFLAGNYDPLTELLAASDAVADLSHRL